MLETILIYWFILSDVLIFGFTFFLFDRSSTKGWMNTLFLLLAVILSLYVSMYVSQLDSLFLFILFFFISIKNDQENSIEDALLVVSLAYCIGWMAALTSWPISAQVIIQNNLSYKLGYTLLSILISILVIIGSKALLEKWLVPLIRKNNLVKYLSYILTCAIFIYQLYQIVQHNNTTPVIKILVLVFYISVTVLIISIMQSLTSNKILATKIENNELEYNMMKRYSDETKKQYIEMRKFRHDYINILSSIEYYLNEDRIVELKEYYNIFCLNKLKLCLSKIY